MRNFDVLGKKINRWARERLLQISVFNTTMILLFMLRSAGYFHPYFLISVNFIVVVALAMAILLLGARSKSLFTVCLLFWIFAGVLRVFNLDVWAERTAIYVYQSLILGILLLIFEEFKRGSYNRWRLR